MTDVLTRLKNLSPEKRELVRRRRKRAETVLPLAPLPRTGWFELSFEQQRLWFLDQLEAGEAVFNVPQAVRLEGAVDVAGLGWALRGIEQRHEVLRTSFGAAQGEPRQRIAEAGAMALPVVDVSEGGEELGRRLAREEARRPFDLAQGPVWRAQLLRLSAGEHVLLVTMHHIVSDGWSMGILVREFAELYAAWCEKREARLEPLAVQYGDFAVWQRQWLREEVLAGQLAYWKEQLRGAETLELPTERARPAVATHRGALQRLGLGRELTAGLRELSRREGVTLFMTLLAAFDVLLARYSGQWDITVGTDIANRRHAHLEKLIGFFVNQLALRVRMEPGLSFRQLLGRVRQVTLEAYDHQDVPFEKLVEELAPERDMSRSAHSPLFGVKLVLQNAPRGELAVGQLKVETWQERREEAILDLVVSVTESAEELQVQMEYATDLYGAAWMERFAEHYRQLLETVVEEAGQPLWALEVMKAGERGREVARGEQSGGDETCRECVQELFERQAERTPEAIAVVCQQRHISYAELNRRANGLAWRLRRAGVGAETVVGLCVERSVEMVVGVLGILKAGGAYAPLDPQYPVERLAWMMEDLGALVVVTQGKLAAGLPTGWMQVVNVEEEEGSEGERRQGPAGGIGAENLAYVLYTSGSSGRPKAVAVRHGSVSSLAAAQGEAFGMGAGSRVLQFSSLNFDASVSEWSTALLGGGCLIVDERENLLPGGPLERRCEEEQVTVATMPPSVLARWEAGEYRALQTLVVAGEACGTELAAGWAKGRRLLDAYGPTETTVCATISAPLEAGERPGIGQPMRNTQVYVLDENLEPVPAGVSGELYIGGRGLARGYLNRGELTAERFVPNPYGEERGGRLYRSGDRARWRSDGTLEYLGRLDEQVKVRGFRIEPGEIAAALIATGAVRQAAVVVREDTPGDKRLVAYVVAEPAAAAAAALRTALAARLPEYMLPSAYVYLEQLPLTPNGKLDRKALPAPEDGSAGGETGTDAAATPVEEMIAGIWAEVLKRERVGRQENFFEIGGHSLLATQVISRMNEVLGCEIPVRAVFEAPTVAGLGGWVEAARQGGAAAAAAPAMRAVTGRENLPLSFGQQRLWFLEQLEPGGAVYNMPQAVRLEGAVDVAGLGWALRGIEQRHEVLRTSFGAAQGEPRQRIAEAGAMALPVVDVSEGGEELGRRLAREEARRPFDLAQGPVWRAQLLRLSAGEHVLLVTMHHIVSDGWSMGILVREFAELYAAWCEKREARLEPLAVQYGDFAVWQRQWLREEVLAGQLAYWKEQLRGAETLELPTERARPAVATHRGALQRLGLGRELTAGLRELSRREGVTLFMTLLAAFDVLLARYSGQWDITVGSPIANRRRVEIEKLIGFFVNQLALRVRMEPGLSFRQLLGRVRQVTLEAYDHQDVPFEKLVEELAPERDMSRAPLFQVMFGFDNAERTEASLGGLQLRDYMALEEPAAKFDLTVTLREQDGEVTALIEYAGDLFGPEWMGRFAEHYRTLLESALRDPGCRLRELDLLAAAERHRLLFDWNNTRGELAPVTLVDLFEQQAESTPDAVAMVCGEECLTYSELNRTAARVARRLKQSGVGPDTLVGLVCNRCAQFAASVLGILKAGGAYLPLDPSNPADRLRFMIDDARPIAILAQREFQASVAGLTRIPTIGFEDAASAISVDRPDESRPGHLTPWHLAYVMYTSGSTGTPKAVAVNHAAVVRLVKSPNYVRLGPEDVFLQLAPLSFDASTFEIWGALLNGGRLVVAPPDAPTLAQMGSLLCDEQVSTLWLTASLLHLIVSVDAGMLAPVRQLLAGGEALSPDAVREILRRLGPGRLINGYGPTESTTFTCCHSVCDESEIEATVPIGQPIRNTQVYVLDENLEPVPAGVSGELYIGGRGLARGYLNRGELTAERFVPNPYGEERGGRLYRSGDRARWRSDGTLEYLGRLDEQVKVRGFRIEPGEIEAALAATGAVRQAAVVVREDTPGDKRLVAYVVAEPAAAAAAALRTALAARLPEYMLPSAYVYLEQLPLTPNGKLDRKALPAPEDGSAGGETGTDAAATPVEEMIAGIWAEVLKRERVGRQENFFEIGGHSLLATQVISRMNEVLGCEIPVRAVFEAPTVAGLGGWVEAARQGGAAAAAAPAMRAVTGRENLPLSFGQQRLWFLEQLEPGGAVYNMPQAVRLEGAVDVAGLGWALRGIEQRHEVLRTSFEAAQGEPRQRIAEAGAMALPVVDVSEGGEELGRRLAREEARRPFDLAQGPVWRAQLLRLSAEEHVLLVTMHHIVSDGWSMGILVREFAELYAAWCEKREARLEPLAVQYGDFAVWQRQWLREEVLAGQLAYWKEQLRGAETLELPTERARPAVATHRGALQRLGLGRELTAGLRELSRREGVTLFMTLLAAFDVLLARYSGQWDITVGSPIANRRRVEIEKLIGFFVNTLALRVRMEPGLSFRQLLGRVRQVTLEAYDHQDVPFEKLVEELAPERDMSRAPLFQVMFGFDNAERTEASLGGLQLRDYMALEEPAAKFDLTVTLREQDGEVTALIEYAGDLFGPEWMGRFAEHYRTLLESALRDPGCRLRELDLLAAAERHRLLFDWNNTRGELAPVTLVDLFEQQAESTPDAVAILDREQCITYGQLDRAANSVAWHLKESGIGAEDLVALRQSEGALAIVSLMGILKTGAAYVPVDPGLPALRQEVLLDGTKATLLSTGSELIARVLIGERSLSVDAIQHGRADRVPTRPVPENAAYAIYTSGSTGTPKGVQVTHAAVCNVLQFFQDELKVTADDTFLAATSLSFDIAALEIFLPLIVGARLTFPDKPGASALIEDSRPAQPTVLQATPSAWSIFLHQNGDLGKNKAVLCGGESLSISLASQLLARKAPLWNVYGPTETTIWSLAARVHSAETTPGIGQPIRNTQVYVLDENLEPVPAGVSGELYIGGRGLARGYLNRGELTAERFVPNPYGEERGGRLYRSGDRARWRSDGTLEYLGRLDEQVKVRGFRIEPGEIEAALAATGAVRQAAVVVREDTPGDKRLVAYVVAEPAAAAAAALRTALAARLPEYMLPSAYVYLEQLPLTPNGKLDRKALPAPEDGSAGGETGTDAAATPVEEMIAGIWAEVLKRERVGRQENFFEIGGHSLLATQVISRMNEVLGCEIPVRAVFEAPTVAGLGGWVEAARQGGAAAAAAPAMRAVTGRENLPLSFGQQRLWFLEQLEPGGAVYNMPQAVRLEGAVDVAGLGWALRGIEQRHEVLRTSFEAAQGEPRQRIAEAGAMALPVVDVSEGGEELGRRLAREEARRPFDLAQGPVWRAQLLRLSAGEHVLLVTMHHIVSDGWSMGILVREFAELYAAWCEKREARLEPLAVQYGDFAVWQRQWLREEVLAGQLAYWKEQLRGAETLELPTERARPAVATHRGALQRLGLGRELTAGLRELSRREGVTLFMTLLAAFDVLLARYSGQWDITVGTDIANRRHAHLEKLIGFFVNQLALRVRMEPGLSFRQLLGRVRQVTLEAYDHQDVPFEKLVEELAPERDMSRAPLFQVKLVLQNTPVAAEDMPGVRARELQSDRSFSDMDLTLMLIESGGEIEAGLEYSTDLFDAAAAERLARRFCRLLEAAVQDPAQHLCELDLLDASDWGIIERLNGPRVEYPGWPVVHQMFEDWAERSPADVALRCSSHSISYAELNVAANRLSRYLRGIGVGPDVIVGVWLDRSVEFLVAILAILKAGGAYLPLDPAYPAERISFMVEDSAAAALLTTRELARRLPVSWAQIVELDAIASDLAQLPADNPGRSAAWSNAAYLIYTSGSTGKPKGVVVNHGNLWHSTRARWRQYAQRAQKYLLTSSFSFDSSVAGIFWTLGQGGTLHLASEAAMRDPEALCELIGRERITHLLCLPSVYRQMLDPGRAEKLSSLQLVIVAGEECDTEVAALHATLLPQARLSNEYGPTEATVWATSFICSPEERRRRIPIGGPIENTEIRVLDAEMNPVPAGIPGEIYIGGEGIARGYWNRPELTAERFVADPFSGRAGGRLYRTGDLGRVLPDCSLEYLGRTDRQIKIRGYRVELQEIEASLREHSGVREVAVIAREDRLKFRNIAAYIVPSETEFSDKETDASCGHAAERLIGELRDFLEARLPAYMRPANYVLLDKLPRGQNGKIAVEALPQPEHAGLKKQRVPPRTGAETTLVRIWSEVLGREVSTDDNFFDLGGHSLLVVQVVSRVRDALGVDLPVGAMFEARTLADLGRMLEACTPLQDAETVTRREPFADDLEQMLAELEQLPESAAEELLESYTNNMFT